MNVKSFLVALKSQIETSATRIPLKFVTGNQSADLDSVISAISYAYFNYRKNDSFLIPLINIPRSEFKLRRDIEQVLQLHSITEDYLYFVEDFRQLVSSMQSKIELVLVDHCNIQGELLTEKLNERKLDVVSIIDHHQDEKVFLNAEPRIIHSNGSCSSLVFNYWYNQFSEKSIFYENDNDVVGLLLAPLLIDTSNMTQKVEQGDVEAFEKYQDILQKVQGVVKTLGDFSTKNAKNTEGILKNFYSTVKVAKKDLSGFKFYEILKKDYKQFEFGLKNDSDKLIVGFSSLGKSFYWLLTEYTQEEISKAFRDILKDLKLDLLIMTTSYTAQETQAYTREFGYCFSATSKQKELFLLLSALAKDDLELNSDMYHLENPADAVKSFNDENMFQIFNQGNIKASRKQVVPIVKDIIESH